MNIDNLEYTYVYDIFFKPSQMLNQEGKSADQMQNMKIPSTRRLPIDEIKLLIENMCEQEPDLSIDRLAHISVHEIVADNSSLPQAPPHTAPANDSAIHVDPKSPILPFQKK